MYPIWQYGSEEQRKKYLPKLAAGEMVGCFGLTEPDHGSNPGGMMTNFKDDGENVILNGAKMWISNSSRSQTSQSSGPRMRKDAFTASIVERGMEGFTTPK